MTSTTLREMLVKQEPRNVSICFVCSGPRAEYSIFSKPYGDHPFFPFLEHHHPPEGAENMKADGRVLTCLVCYTFLTQQWDSFEKSKTPHNKRIYWLKRLDGGPFAGMDLNLQQDYESLFETSSAGNEADCRPKHKHSRSHYLTNLDVKPKLNERPEQIYPNIFGITSRSNDKIENTSNILDLSLPARTPSRTSNSSSPAMNIEVCYLCGQESKCIINVYVKPIANCPYFPSIMLHPKPPNAKPMDSNGKIHSCENCHRMLLQQWDYYQRKNTPQNERVYQLKIVSSLPSKGEDSSNKSFVCFTCGTLAQVSVQRFIHAYPEKNGDPHFSFLLNLNPHPGASNLVNGKATVCSLCYKTLFRQLRVYELSKTPEEKRKYKILNESISDNFSVLRQHLKSSGQESEVKYGCYICEYITDTLVSINTFPLSEIHFPFIKSMPKPANAYPIDNDGRVKVCSQCHSSLVYQFDAFERAHVPVQQRQYKINSKLLNKENHFHENSLHLHVSTNIPHYNAVMSEDSKDFSVRKCDICSLCERPLYNENVCYIETVPRENSMYFPSIRLLLKSNTKAVDQYGRVLACNQCHLILKNQWEVFESAHVPHSQRHYEIFAPQIDRNQSSNFSNDIHLPNTSAALHIQVSSPDLKVDLIKHPNIEPLLTTVNTLSVTTITSTNASASNSPQMNEVKSSKSQSNTEEPIPRISGPLDVPITRPLFLPPMHCYVCNELNVSGLTYSIKSLPTVPVGVDKPPEEVPFFPFLTKHIPPDGEKLRNDGSALICMFCYYSLISQWLAYESSPYPEDSNRWHRRYNTHNYVCYICGIITYRKRVCTISVKDFPFLLEHARPAGALTVLNGECVVTCQTCFESITSQWKDFERMKVPVEMRKYNWIVMPPPPDDENSRGCQILTQDNSGSTSSLSQPESDQVHADDQSIPSGLKPPPPHLTVPSAYSLTKPVSRNVISPVHQSSSHSNTAFSPFGNNVNPALNATRTSSFAAALRKLAKQAVDPIAEKDLSPISPASSPASNHQSNHSRHHASLPVYLNNHNSNPTGHRASPPVVSVPPMQSSQGKALDLGRYSSSTRNGNLPEPVSFKMESSKMPSSCPDKRNDHGNKHLPSNDSGLRSEHSMSSRGFQPYRNAEERHSTPPQVYNPSPPPTTVSGYPYHSSYVQSSQIHHQPYRLEESVYMERYGLLRPSAMPYPPASNMLPQPRAPLYPTSHYPPELLPQSMRPAPSSSAVYNTSRYHREEENEENSSLKKHETDSYREQERYVERKERDIEREYRDREAEYLRKERYLQQRESPILHSHSGTRADMSADDKGHLGSITHGTPRDYVRRMTPPPVTVPLNLATNMAAAENELVVDEEMNAKMLKFRNKAVINGQVHHRSGSHINAVNYRKEGELGSYKISYQMNSENHSKPVVSVANTEGSVISTPTKVIPFYVERDFQKSEVVETRTLSMASVINSQINGIFAREKFVSNNSYDYLNSFTSNPEKSIFSDNSHKSKTESKSALSISETSVSHLKSNSKAPIQESSKFDAVNSKLPSFLFNDHPRNSNSESSNYPPVLKPRDTSITRALLQNPVTTSYESDVHMFEEPLPKVISVLDKREEKLRKLRKAGEMLESDYSDPDSDEEDTEHLKQLLKITKGPPPKMVPDPKKTKFLLNFALVTHSKKETIELKKCLRRHQMLREKSCSPVPEEPPKPPVIEYDPMHLSELSKRLCLEEDFEAKTEFFKMLGLVYLTPEEQAEKLKIQKVVENERLRRNGLLEPSQQCLDLQGSQLGKRASSVHSLNEMDAKKPNLNLNSSENIKEESSAQSDKSAMKKDHIAIKPFKSYANSSAKMSAFLKPPLRSANLPVPPLIPANQVIPPLTEPARDAPASVVAPKDPRVRQLHKEFAQEFHNSVLQTTQMQLAEKKNLGSSVHLETSFLKSPSTSTNVEKPGTVPEYRLAFRWPGIEAIMESYECHISEQNTERSFLVNNCQKLKALIQESNTEIECLGRKTEDLLHEQKRLEIERRDLQSKIEALGLFIKHFR